MILRLRTLHIDNIVLDRRTVMAWSDISAVAYKKFLEDIVVLIFMLNMEKRVCESNSELPVCNIIK